MTADILDSQRRLVSYCKASVLIIDDEPASRLGIALRIKHAGHDVVGTASDGLDGLLKIPRCSPNLIVLDMDMPRMEGLSVLREVRRHYPRLKVLVLTMLNAKVYAHRCMLHGAVAFLDKNEGLDLLAVAIERVQKGCRIFPSTADEMASTSDLLLKLTDRELVLLRCVARGLNETCIAEALQVNTATVGNIRKLLHNKIGTSSQKELAQFARNQKLG